MSRDPAVRVLLGVSMFLLVSAARCAIAATAADCTAGTVVLYVNGIRTDQAGAQSDAVTLRSTINVSQTSDGKPVRYVAVHNPNNGTPGDLVETFIQWIDQNPVRAFLRPFAERIVAALFSGVIDYFFDELALIAPSFAGTLRTETEDFLRAAAAQYLTANNRVTEIAALVKSKIETYIQQGNRVIIVTHSQGNFVGNAAITSMAASLTPAVRMVGVAPPTSSIATNGPYAKLKFDVLNLVPGSLPFNVDQSSLCPGDRVLNHAFAACYISFSAAARGKIIEGVSGGFSLTLPPQTIGLGIVSATLTWGAQPDVDLHVFEPNGAHVYYANRIGPSGTLDRDDTDGFGPENYAVCERPVEVGLYRIGVNYYYGTAPETANINVKAGGVSRPFSVALPSALGAAGNSSPIPVATVVVTTGQDGVLHFEIQ
jgi:hypothetical protein